MSKINRISIAWTLIALCWIVDPKLDSGLGLWLLGYRKSIIDDQYPALVSWVYYLLLGTTIGYGLYVGWTERSPILMIASVLTIFKWLIIFFFVTLLLTMAGV